MELLKHFPYATIRSFQKETLEILEEKWDKYDVFVIVAPTAFGKSALSKTVLKAVPSSSYIVPTNQLVDQFIAAFPDTKTLRRLDSYRCETWKRSCLATRASFKGFCKGCECGSAMAVAKYRNGPGVYTYHAYLAHRLYRDVLIVDEAHQMIPMLQSMGEVILWQHDYQYPSSCYRPEQLLRWAESLPLKKKQGKKVELLLKNLKSSYPDYSIVRAVREFNGKGTKKGEPEERNCIVMTPMNVKEQGKKMWPTCKKIILLSATINFKDIEALGLSHKKVAYIKSPSPIPVERRPFIIDSVTSVSRGNINDATALMARYIKEVLYVKHKGERGLIHATYQMAELLRNHLTEPCYLFHTRENKKEMYQRYLNTPGGVLVACGMHEGIDLPDDAGRWQVILKIPWPSLGNPAIAALADRDEEWYLWQTAKTLIQAGGRVSRHEVDFGITYCLDGTFSRLYNKGHHLMPSWFTDCLVDGKSYE